MRKVIAAEHITLDGLFAGPSGEIDFFKPQNEEMAKYAINQLVTTDTILFGRVTYEMMASYWTSASAPAEDPILIDKMNNLPKIVFSRTLERAEWTNSRLIKDNIAEEIQKMKQQPGKNMVILGSGSIVSAFINLGLIDEYQLFVNPIVLGKGKPLFKGLNDRHGVTLTNTKTFSNGVVLLHYRSDTGDFN